MKIDYNKVVNTVKECYSKLNLNEKDRNINKNIKEVWYWLRKTKEYDKKYWITYTLTYIPHGNLCSNIKISI